MNAETVDNRQSIIDWLGNEPNLEKYGIRSWETDLKNAILEALKLDAENISAEFFMGRNFDQGTQVRAVGIVNSIHTEYKLSRLKAA